MRTINTSCAPVIALYFYSNPTYSTIYDIIDSYKNYLNYPKIVEHKQFNKVILRFRVKVDHGFAIHQNFWTWNGFYLRLKIQQGAEVGYAVLILLATVCICF